MGVRHARGVPGGEEGTGMRRPRLSAVSYKQRVKETSVFPKREHLPLMSLRGVGVFFSLSFFFQGRGEWKKVLA